MFVGTAVVPRGKPLPLPEFYACKPSDKRIKSTLLIVNESISPHRELCAVVLCDGGAEGDKVKLPPRKIVQLGLEPVPITSGGRFKSVNADGSKTDKLIFEPQVTVRIQFKRLDTDTIEDRAVKANVACGESDWYAYINTLSSVSDVNSPPSNTPILPAEPSSPVSSTILNSHVIATIQLSPVGHRMQGPNVPDELRSQTCAIGEGLLEKLGVHSNHVEHILEIEEEVIEEDE